MKTLGKNDLQFVHLKIEILQSRRFYDWILRLQDYWRVVRFVKRAPMRVEACGGSGSHLLPADTY